MFSSSLFPFRTMYLIRSGILVGFTFCSFIRGVHGPLYLYGHGNLIDLRMVNRVKL